MGAITTVWVKDTPFGTDGTLASSASSSDSIDLSASGYDMVKVYINVTMGTSNSIKIEFFGENGTSTSTVAAPAMEVVANGTYDFEIANTPGINVTITNTNGGTSGTITRRYDARTWNSA